MIEAKFGLSVAPITQRTATQLGLHSTEGVVIIGVAPGTKGYWAGLRVGDAIVAIDLEPVTSIETWNAIVSEMDDDATPMLTVIRMAMLVSGSRYGFASMRSRKRSAARRASSFVLSGKTIRNS